MASLLIRDLDESVKAQLRLRAAQNGRSMEAEARELLGVALDAESLPRRLGSHIHARFAAVGGVEIDVPARADRAPVADFS